MAKRILILTDSIGNPQPYLGDDSTSLEQTFPFLIKKDLKDTIFHQITLGHAMSSELISQARGYISSWKPEYIIMCSGINDATPVFFSEKEKKILFKYLLINKIGRNLKNFIKNKIFYNERILWLRSRTRENDKNFILNLKKFSNSFRNSKIYWYEIFVGEEEEMKKKNILGNIKYFNQILDDQDDIKVIKVKNKLLINNGIAKDNIHLNIAGHQTFAKSFLELIKN